MPQDTYLAEDLFLPANHPLVVLVAGWQRGCAIVGAVGNQQSGRHTTQGHAQLKVANRVAATVEDGSASIRTQLRHQVAGKRRCEETDLPTRKPVVETEAD